MKILVLGDGLLGSEIVKQTNWDCISRKKDGFDITSSEFNFIEYDTIVNCIAYTNTYSNDRDLNWNINYKSVANLVDYCNKYNSKLVHISTDYVYTNSISNASELDIPIHGNNWYSYTKLLADAYIELKSNNYLICRGTHKPNPFPYENAWINQLGNFDYVDTMASLIIDLVMSNNFGIFNVGTEFKSMFDLAKVTNENVKPVGKPEHVPNNTSMNIEKFNKLFNKNE
jgi:dTDP-4-dehydrorhamnose reductase